MKTVLLIDDDQVVRAALARACRAAGWTVLEADDGDAGLEQALRHRPAVMVCDLFMPRYNGFQLARAVRGHADRLGRPLIIMTSVSAYESDRKNALEAGADEYLVKPVRTTELLEHLARVAPAESPPTPGADGGSGQGPPEPVRLRFWGVRGSVASPGAATVFYGGNTACVEVRSDGELIVLDAGTGIRPLGLALVEEFDQRPIELTILVSHMHWDHIQGLPFFVPAYNAKNLIRILGYEGARRGLEITLAAQMESPYFPVGLEQMPGNITVEELRELKFSVGQVQVQAAFFNHPGNCAGYRLFTSGGSIAYLPDVEPHRPFGKSDAEARADPEQLLFAQREKDKLVGFVRDADVLIMDAQYSAEEYKAHVGWGHSSVDQTVALAVEANVKRLFLFHHDPAHDDAQVSRLVEDARKLVAQRGSQLVVDAAREGLEVVLAKVAEPRPSAD
jgi:phosphoribosyl 1,2-cyclic phosphodiesterase/CheY-like chemotaxis protein